MMDTRFKTMGELVAKLRSIRGPVCVDAMAGAGFDPIEVAIVKSDMIATLSDWDAASEPPFYLYTNSNGAQFLVAV